jgi:hypothetical protein
MRSVAFSVIRDVEFGTAVVCPVAFHCIPCLLELRRHGTSRRCHAFGYQTGRIDCCQPIKVLLAGVDAIGTVAISILCEEFSCELNEPPIIIE